MARHYVWRGFTVHYGQYQLEWGNSVIPLVQDVENTVVRTRFWYRLEAVTPRVSTPVTRYPWGVGVIMGPWGEGGSADSAGEIDLDWMVWEQTQFATTEFESEDGGGVLHVAGTNGIGLDSHAQRKYGAGITEYTRYPQVCLGALPNGTADFQLAVSISFTVRFLILTGTP